jgi:hypothetical protein
MSITKKSTLIPTEKNILILGSAPDALIARNWIKHPFDAIVCINNSWKIRSDWTHSIFPTDFPTHRHAKPSKNQSLHSADEYVLSQNKYGGFVYAGGTMAFTAGYWSLDVLEPTNICFLGCDMVYSGNTNHFYGTGTADPLRPDITLRSLEAKSARFEAHAMMKNCIVCNLSNLPESRLVFKRKKLKDILKNNNKVTRKFDIIKIKEAIKKENDLGYFIESGKYWKYFDSFNKNEIDKLDKLWLSSITK